MTALATLPVVLGTGIHSARPAAADVGSGGLYSCTTHSLVYQTDGTTWTTWATLGGTSGLVFLEGHVASSSAQLDFTSFISSTYDTYLIEGSYIRPASDAVDFQMEFGSGGGPTWDTGNNYSFVTSMVNIGTATTVLDDANTGIPRIFKSIANASQYGVGSFTLTGTDLQSTSQRRKFHGTGIYANTTTPAERMGTIGVTWNDITNAMTGIRFKMSSGNIASGVIRIYGLSKS